MLWIFNHYVPLPRTPGGVRHISLARQLNLLGWDVCLVCATTESPAVDARAGAFPPRNLMDLDGINVLALRVPKSYGNGPRRVLNMSAFGVSAALSSATRELPRADLVIGSSVHPLAALAGARQARMLGVPFVFETRDLWPETFVRLGRMKRSSPLAKALYGLESRLWAQSSMILSPLGQVPDYAHARGLPVRPFLHVPNGVETALFDWSQRPHDGPLRLGYFGSHGNTDYLEVIVEALAEPEVRSRSDEFSVQFFGWGPHKESLRDMARRLGLTNLEFRDPVDRDGLPEAMSAMDAFLFPLGDSGGLYAYGASPNKLQDYMAAGRPILMNAPFRADPVTSSGGGGILVPECTPTSWAAGLLTLLETSPEERRVMGARLRRLAEEKYDFDVLGAELDLGLRSVINV